MPLPHDCHMIFCEMSDNTMYITHQAQLSVLPLSPLHPTLPPRIPDGELIEHIIANNDLTEGVAVGYIAQLLSALECIHKMDIAHLDIKVVKNDTHMIVM